MEDSRLLVEGLPVKEDEEWEMVVCKCLWCKVCEVEVLVGLDPSVIRCHCAT